MQALTSRPLALCSSSRSRAAQRAPATARASRLVVRAGEGDGESKVVREYREDDGTLSTPGAAAGGGEQQQGSGDNYVPRDTMSKEMKARLRKEYVSLGGSPDQPMGSNYFLTIILIISFLAVLSWLTGAI